MRGAVALGSFLVLVVAGCAGPPADAVDEPAFDTLDLQATATTGVIRGVVVDEAVRPLEGVTIELVSTGQATTTTADGLFGFAGLAPGTYFLATSKAGYVGTQQSTDVVVDQAEPPIVKVMLVADAGYLPYSALVAYDGWIECTTSFLVLCGAPNTVEPILCEAYGACYGNLTNDRFTWYFYYDANVSWLQTELVWESSQALSPELTLEMETLSSGCEDDDYYFNVDGPSPIVWGVNGSTVADTEVNLGPDCPVYYSIFSGEAAGTPAGVTVEQRFKAFSVSFYQYEPPEGWSFVATGEVPPPPA